MDDESRKLCKTLILGPRPYARDYCFSTPSWLLLPTNTPSIVCPPQASSAVITTDDNHTVTRARGQITTGALDNDDDYEDLFSLMNPPFDGLTMLKRPYSWIIQCDCLATLECARDNAYASPLVCRTSVICIASTTLSAKLARMAISAHAMSCLRGPTRGR